MIYVCLPYNTCHLDVFMVTAMNTSGGNCTKANTNCAHCISGREKLLTGNCIGRLISAMSVLSGPNKRKERFFVKHSKLV